MKTLYDKLVEAGCEIDHYESDLYVRSTREACNIIREEQAGLETKLVIHEWMKDGQLWLELPFLYEPYWRNKT